MSGERRVIKKQEAGSGFPARYDSIFKFLRVKITLLRWDVRRMMKEVVRVPAELLLMLNVCRECNTGLAFQECSCETDVAPYRGPLTKYCLIFCPAREERPKQGCGSYRRTIEYHQSENLVIYVCNAQVQINGNWQKHCRPFLYT